MKLKHVHVGVRDLPKALAWFETAFDERPAFRNHALAYLRLDDVTLVLDQADEDALVTMAIDCPDVDREFARLVDRGIEPFSPPTTQKWGVRSAYLRGPGRLCIELEQVLAATEPS